MLSSIASFLPSALHLNSSSSHTALNPTDNPIEEAYQEQPAEEDPGAKKEQGASKPRNASEVRL